MMTDFGTIYRERLVMARYSRICMMRLLDNDNIPLETIHYFDHRTWMLVLEEEEKRLFAGLHGDGSQYRDLLELVVEYLPCAREDLPSYCLPDYDTLICNKEFCKYMRAVSGYFEFHEV